MDNFVTSYETVIRLAMSFGLFAVLAIREIPAPGRRPGRVKSLRSMSNIAINRRNRDKYS